MTIPYTYRIQFIPTGEYYYGVRYAKNCHPNELWVRYFTSSKKVKNLIRKYGKDKFITEIRRTFSSADMAILWEHRVNTKTKLWKNYLNESDAKHQGSKYSSIGGIISKSQKVGVHDPERPWLNNPDIKNSIKEAQTKGGAKTGAMPWWNNGIQETKSIDCPGAGWRRGMLSKGYYWNNGKDQKVCLEPPGPEWIRGGLNKTVNGRKWWNNGIEQKMSFDRPFTDWIPGKLPGSSNWWNNGVEQKRQKNIPGPEWKPGMLK